MIISGRVTTLVITILIVTITLILALIIPHPHSHPRSILNPNPIFNPHRCLLPLQESAAHQQPEVTSYHGLALELSTVNIRELK